jgi:hypothetical protein
MSENIVTKTEFAKILNRKPSYVSELVKYGRVVLDESGKKILVAESLKLIEESKDLTKVGVAQRHAKARAEKTENQSAPIGTNENPIKFDDDSQTYWQKRHIAAKAKKAEQELELSMGLLLVADDVIKTVANAISVIRQRFESQPDRLSAQLAAESDPNRCRTMLVDDNEIFLTELSQLFSTLSKS